jgi:dienelactone hydrolase
MREQLWLLPSADPGHPLRATVFRPTNTAPMPWGGNPGDPRPMVVINHGTSEWTRQAVSMPVYYWLSRWFVERGFVVVLPQRRGHGATGGDLVEARGNCSDPDHYTSGRIAAADIGAAVTYMQSQDFVAPNDTLVVGISSGGWASLALAGLEVEGLRGVVSFAGGRGGHAWGKPGAICGEPRLLEAAARYGAAARVPSIWLYSGNDSFFGPELAHALHEAYTGQGGDAELVVLPSYGTDGHTLADDQAGWRLWGTQLSAFLARVGETAVVARASLKAPAPDKGTAAEGASRP